ncbi:GGDEF domain-containing protein [Sporosalibacterium faouarense]|uniref:GGDEF domain-containing protein n=1 Tax=Sporosalibacterium faouarense TaxID=516123 RepID=UPI00141C267E|nr:GGDEF domain-containing protein [Sporosalibacterium faouarense]MTI48292.1 GGDEF domain-containing protein [Bacillota bacterium]
MEKYIGEIVHQVSTVSSDVLGKEVNEKFEGNNTIEGVVILSERRPIGLITKVQFYQALGKQYGYALYMKRPIKLIMDNNPLIVDYYTPILDVSKLSMKRKQEKLYDYIIVSKNDRYYGVVSIRDLLLKISEIRVEDAMCSSPLTGLPGNQKIEEKLREILDEEQYSILYFDLDNFKAYNDLYGFKNGDGILQLTGTIIKDYTIIHGGPDAFIGHIGGDDFIVILNNYEYKSICEAIGKEFNKKIIEFYNGIDRARGYIITNNRHGIQEQFPIMSISIAIVTNREKNYRYLEEISTDAANKKKKCKEVWSSCYCDGKVCNL